MWRTDISSPDQDSLWQVGVAAATAGGVGAIALLHPPLAVLCLAALAMLALVRTGPSRLSIAVLLGPLVAAAIVGAFIGLAGAVGVLFLWRLFEDARWSASRAARLRRISGLAPLTSPLASAHIWLTPIYGAALVAYTAPHMIAGLPLDLPHAPAWTPIVVGVLALAAFADWALRQAVDWRLGQVATASAAHLLSHHALFAIAFGLGLDVSAGIVAIAAWRLAIAARLRLPQVSFTAVP